MFPNTEARTEKGAGVFDNTFHKRKARHTCMRCRLLAWLQVFVGRFRACSFTARRTMLFQPRKYAGSYLLYCLCGTIQ